MHFWIDKRSQTCGFSGRHRVPSSISSGGFGGRHRQRGGAGGFGVGVGALGLGLCSSSSARNYNCHPPQAHVKLMVTPVHRFQSIECVTNNGRRYNPHGLHHRGSSRWQSSSGLQHQHQHHAAPSASPSNFNHHHHQHSTASANANASSHANSGHRQGSEAQHATSSLDLEPNNAATNFLEIPSLEHGRTSASSDLHHHHHNMMLPAAGKLKCGMWASFAIVTVFMVGAKFYFNNQSTGMEVLIFCSLLVVVLFAGCTVSLCEAVTSAPAQPLTTPIIIDSTANRLSPSPHRNRAVSEDLDQHPLIQQHSTSNNNNNNTNNSSDNNNGRNTAPTIDQSQPQPQPPPPYHIAVLLPQHQPNNNTSNNQHHIIIVDDSPPPSYDKVVIS